MPEDRGAPQDPWDTCVALGELVFRVHDQVSYERERRLDWFRSWSLRLPAAEALVRTLLALVLRSLSQDAFATTGRHLAPAELRDLRLTEIEAVAVSRLPYELFAGLDRAAMTAPEQRQVNLLDRLVLGDLMGSLLTVERLRAETAATLRRLRDRSADQALTFHALTWLDTAPLPDGESG
ncbi:MULTISPECIES: hypothetical protein [unclassified Streptomyces]|uniref:hypothetical protein n=1 Tax=unclassified Streptomyces TaxID=2593676 RepID=UPI002E2A13B6|nr:hypothetical protein [Streptomyces sp. NBC_00223]